MRQTPVSRTRRATVSRRSTRWARSGTAGVPELLRVPTVGERDGRRAALRVRRRGAAEVKRTVRRAPARRLAGGVRRACAIGEPRPGDRAGTAEQAAVSSATASADALSDGNAPIEARFGHVFLIRAAAAAPRAARRADDRLGNSPAEELRIAARRSGRSRPFGWGSCYKPVTELTTHVLDTPAADPPPASPCRCSPGRRQARLDGARRRHDRRRWAHDAALRGGRAAASAGVRSAAFAAAGEREGQRSSRR